MNEKDKELINYSMEEIHKAITLLKSVFGNNLNIENIAILYNNKLIIAISEFRRLGIENTSELLSFYKAYLFESFIKGLNILKRYIALINRIVYLSNELEQLNNLFNRKNIKLEIDFLVKESKKYLEMYQKECNKLYESRISSIIPYIDERKDIMQRLSEKAKDTPENIKNNCIIECESIETGRNLLHKKHKNRINCPLDIINYYLDKINEVERNNPDFLEETDFYLTILREEAEKNYKEGNYDKYLEIREKIIKFNIQEHIIEIVGINLAFWKTLYKDEPTEIETIFNEIIEKLKNNGHSNIIEQIKREYESDMYISIVTKKAQEAEAAMNSARLKVIKAIASGEIQMERITDDEYEIDLEGMLTPTTEPETSKNISA